MFQSFNATTSPDQGPPRLAKLRDWMHRQSIDGFLVPRADRHQGEYVAPCDARLSWLTGFTGSAGFACVLKQTAGVFIDGRYRLQVLDQVADEFTPVHWPETSLAAWLKTKFSNDAVIGFDPWLHTVAEVKTTRKDLEGTGIKLKACANGVDAVWTDRPDAPKHAAWGHDLEFSGKGSNEKRDEIAQALKAKKVGAAVLTMPDSICWLLNVRGSDIERTPIVQAFAIIDDTGHVSLFSDMEKFAKIGPDERITGYDWVDFETQLAKLDGRVMVDPASLPQAALTALMTGSAQIVHGTDPCGLPKACKNATELAGARDAHLKDAAAFVEFLAWFSKQDQSTLDEITVVKALEEHRRTHAAIHDISFETICGSGPNGAIVHYRVTEQTNRKLDKNSLLLIDSGAQYPQGTTDITRVLPLGMPSPHMKAVFTAVLKGVIDVSMLRFAKGVAGQHIDSIARAPLWSMGLDFDHGTGHGVGSFLSVHEGPQRISRISNVPFAAGMIVSNEPGYYKTGEFGIRIENLIAVKTADKITGADNRDMLSFETLTFVPIDTDLIDASMLSDSQKDWLNTYHKQVFEKLNGMVSSETASWLKTATAAV